MIGNVNVGLYPDTLQYVIDLGDLVMGTVLELNENGRFLALGTNDGRILIYDFQTKSLSKQLIPYSKESNADNQLRNKFVMSINWFNYGRYILAAYYDTSVIIWNIELGKILRRFDSYHVWKAYVCPSDDKLILISLLSGAPVLLKIDYEIEEQVTSTQLPIEPFIHKSKKRVDYNYACFNNNGRYIFIGNSIGQIVVLRIPDLKLLCIFHAAQDLIGIQTFTINEDLQKIDQNVEIWPAKLKKGDYGVKQIVFSKQDKYMLVSCENSIRLFEEISSQDDKNKTKTQYIYVRELRDLVTNQPFYTCSFSGWNGLMDSEFIIATTSSEIYIWERETGVVLKMLECIRETFTYSIWHPYRPIIVASTNGGSVQIWGKMITENWSAFAPGFIELESNEMYIEREDEFDEPALNIPSSLKNNKDQLDNNKEENEDSFVDIINLSEEQQRSELQYFLPAIPVPDKEMKQYNEQIKSFMHVTNQKHADIAKKKQATQSSNVLHSLSKKRPSSKRRENASVKQAKKQKSSDCSDGTSNSPLSPI
jgi:COMPASS component SWD1